MSAVTPLRVTPGTALLLRASSMVDANGITLDNSTAAAKVSLNAQNGNGAIVGGLNGSAVPYEAAGAWHLVIPGQDQVRTSMPARCVGQVTTADGATLRSVAEWTVAAAPAAQGKYQPGQSYRFKLTGLLMSGATPPAGWTVQATVIDQAGHGITQVNAAAGIVDSTTACHYDVAATVMVAGADLLVTLQIVDAGGNKVLAQEWRVTAEW